MDFITNIKLKKHLLTKNELRACDEILDNILLVQKLSFTELSEKIGITKASILRFCKKVGFSGYNEFRYECIRHVNSIHNVDTDDKDEIKTHITKVGHMYSDILNLMNKVIDEEEVKKLIKFIREARRIRAVGVINSAIPCHQLRYAFLMFGVEIDVINSEAELKAIDLSINSKDLTIIFSVSAKSEYVKNAIDYTKNVGGKTALITMNVTSECRNNVDVFITLPSVSNLKNESLLNSVPIFSVFIEILNVYYNS